MKCYWSSRRRGPNVSFQIHLLYTLHILGPDAGFLPKGIWVMFSTNLHTFACTNTMVFVSLMWRYIFICFGGQDGDRA